MSVTQDLLRADEDIIHIVKAFNLQLVDFSLDSFKKLSMEKTNDLMECLYDTHAIISQMKHAATLSHVELRQTKQVTISFGSIGTRLDCGMINSSESKSPLSSQKCYFSDRRNPVGFAEQLLKRPKINGQLMVEHLSI